MKNKKVIKKLLFSILSLVLIFIIFSIYKIFHCPESKPEEVRKISIPLQNKILEYKKTNGEYPSTEFVELIENLGCRYKPIDPNGFWERDYNYKCGLKKYRIYEVWNGSDPDTKWVYSFEARYKNTECSYVFSTDNEVVENCHRDKCLGDPF